MSGTPLQDLDRDGAIEEAMEAVQHHDRRGMLRKIGLVAGGGVIAGVVPFTLATAQGGLSKGDVEILNYALTLEELEAAFYEKALADDPFDDASVRTFAQVVAAHERQHVNTLRSVLGGKAKKSPSFDFKDTTRQQKAFLQTARVLEDTGVSAYQGQADKIDSTEVLASAGAILAVEARHAAWVRNLIGGGKAPTPAPAAFNEAMSMQEVLDAVEQTGFIQ